MRLGELPKLQGFILGDFQGDLGLYSYVVHIYIYLCIFDIYIYLYFFNTHTHIYIYNVYVYIYILHLISNLANAINPPFGDDTDYPLLLGLPHCSAGSGPRTIAKFCSKLQFV